jgi:hypothetical protein
MFESNKNTVMTLNDFETICNVKQQKKHRVMLGYNFDWKKNFFSTFLQPNIQPNGKLILWNVKYVKTLKKNNYVPYLICSHQK